MRLRRHQALTLEDAPHGGDRRRFVEVALQPLGDALGTIVVAGLGQLAAEADDLGNYLVGGLLGVGTGPAGTRLEGWVAALAKALQELEEPAPGDPVGPCQTGRTLAAHHHRVDQVPRSLHPAHLQREESGMS